MAEAERRVFEEVAARLRTAGAAATALGCGHRDNHGGSLGSVEAARSRLVSALSEACLLLHHAGDLDDVPGHVLVPVAFPAGEFTTTDANGL